MGIYVKRVNLSVAQRDLLLNVGVGFLLDF